RNPSRRRHPATRSARTRARSSSEEQIVSSQEDKNLTKAKAARRTASANWIASKVANRARVSEPLGQELHTDRPTLRCRRKLPAGCLDLAATSEAHGRRNARPVEHALERCDGGAR